MAPLIDLLPKRPPRIERPMPSTRRRFRFRRVRSTVSRRHTDEAADVRDVIFEIEFQERNGHENFSDT